jgi:hypothetical protein
VRQTFILVHEEARRRALDAVRNAPDGYVVKIQPPTRTLDQNGLIHPVVRAIKSHMETHGARKRSEDWWRYYLLGKFAGSEVCEDPDGSGGVVVMNRETGTSGMDKERASEFIEWMYAWGSEIGVMFGDEVAA